MPEGPEIRRAADRVSAVIEGKVADRVFFAFEHLEVFEEVLAGRTIDEVTTRGKAMLTRFAGGLTVYTHNQLYGLWQIEGEGHLPTTKRQVRFAASAGGRQALLYSASEIEVLDVEAERTHPFLSRLGPDVLSQAPTVSELAARLKASRFHGRQLGAVLLDQSLAAGLGNYLRAEILFEARVHPRRRAVDCSGSELKKLAGRTIALTRRAYRTRGITLAPSRVRPLKSAACGARNIGSGCSAATVRRAVCVEGMLSSSR